MFSKLSEGGIYVEEEDLTDAPPGVLQFFLALKEKKSSKTVSEDRRRAEAGSSTQQDELGELIRSLTETVRRSARQDLDAALGTSYPEALSSPAVINKIDTLIAAANVLGTRQSRDLGKNPQVGQPLQEPSKDSTPADDIGKLRAKLRVELRAELRAEVRAEVRAELRAELRAEVSQLLQVNSEERESGEASALTFDRDAAMSDESGEPAEHGRMPGRAQDDEAGVESSRDRAQLGNSSAAVKADLLLPVKDLGPTSPLPNSSGSDSDVLEELVLFGLKHWPGKNLDCFRPGQLVTGYILNEVLRADVPAQYGLGVPPNRVQKLQETCAGIVFPYHVNDTNQLSEDENERNHFVIAIVNKQDKTFTSWGMSEAMVQKSKVEYEKALCSHLATVSYKVRNREMPPLQNSQPANLH